MWYLQSLNCDANVWIFINHYKVNALNIQCGEISIFLNTIKSIGVFLSLLFNLSLATMNNKASLDSKEIWTDGSSCPFLDRREEEQMIRPRNIWIEIGRILKCIINISINFYQNYSSSIEMNDNAQLKHEFLMIEWLAVAIEKRSKTIEWRWFIHIDNDSTKNRKHNYFNDEFTDIVLIGSAFHSRTPNIANNNNGISNKKWRREKMLYTLSLFKCQSSEVIQCSR